MRNERSKAMHRRCGFLEERLELKERREEWLRQECASEWESRVNCSEADIHGEWHSDGGRRLPWQLPPKVILAIGGLFRAAHGSVFQRRYPAVACFWQGVLPTVSPLKACCEALLITGSSSPGSSSRQRSSLALRPHFQGQPTDGPLIISCQPGTDDLSRIEIERL